MVAAGRPSASVIPLSLPCPHDGPSKLVFSVSDYLSLHSVFSISLVISQVAAPGVWRWGCLKLKPRGLEYGF